MADGIIVGHANTMHDPAIAILTNKGVYAEALERHMQCKRALEGRFWYSRRAIADASKMLGGFPVTKGTKLTLLSTWDPDLFRSSEAGLARSLRDLGGAAVLSRPPAYPTQPMDERILCSKDWGVPIVSLQIAAMRSEAISVEQLQHFMLGEALTMQGRPTALDAKRKAVPHHLCHAAAAALTSPFEEAAVVVLDGSGERSTGSFYRFSNNSFELIHEGSTDSLGFLYAMITIFCGFEYWEGEEWKVMGLAAYGKEESRILEFFRKRIRVNDLAVETAFSDACWAELWGIVGGFRDRNDPNVLRSANLAHSFQKVFEEKVIELMQNFARKGISRNLCFGGGVALNSSLNGKILPQTDFDRLHVPSAPADDGNALGAVLFEKHCVRKEPRTPQIFSPYLGSEPNYASLERATSFGGFKIEKMASDVELVERVSEILASGGIVGWMQGRAEFGPRALGNRSIIADPRDPKMQERINNTVKFREEYRPLAPSILHEHGPEYFENYQESPYMERALVFREEVRSKVPAVVHKDGTGRLQSVKRESNPLYFDLITAFHRRTGVPIILNTSLNVMGKPIVHSIEDALTVFYSSGLSHMVIGRTILTK